MAVDSRNDDLALSLKGLLVANGRARVRRAGFVLDHTHLKCPDGHRVHEFARIGSDGHLWCVHRERAGAKECGSLLYILVIPQRGARRKLWASDVTLEEMHLFERKHFDVDQILQFLGADFPDTEAKVAS